MEALTLEQAKNLKIGQILFHMTNKNYDGTSQRWKVNGKVKLWKRNSDRVQVPIKHGLRTYAYVNEYTLHLLSNI